MINKSTSKGAVKLYLQLKNRLDVPRLTEAESSSSAADLGMTKFSGRIFSRVRPFYERAMSALDRCIT